MKDRDTLVLPAAVGEDVHKTELLNIVLTVTAAMLNPGE
jgi:hypothetical protein